MPVFADLRVRVHVPRLLPCLELRRCTAVCGIVRTACAPPSLYSISRANTLRFFRDKRVQAADVEVASDEAAGAAEAQTAKIAQAPKPREPAVNLTKQLNARFQLGPARTNPVVSMVLGMAGSGKTTLMQRIAVHIHENQTPSYIINLDPAVTSVPYGCNIDIRDTVNYKEVMKQYQLGPNGGIMTSLNLFATKFDQVMSLVENKADSLEHIFVDTPGQIEIFTWSASGTIISDMFAYSFPTVLLYVIDTPRCTSPVTFMSNMLYACSIMYKFKLPFIVVFNKTDITSADFALEWMQDYEKFQVCAPGPQRAATPRSCPVCREPPPFPTGRAAASRVSDEAATRH